MKDIKVRILGVYIEDRVKNGVEVQKVLTKHGCLIKTRLGLHESTAVEGCAIDGLVILELIGKFEEWEVLEKELAGINGVKLQKMDF